MAEEGEDPLACMVREVKEESGLDISGFDAHLIYTFEEGNGFTFYTFAVFIPDDHVGLADNIEISDEVENWRWSKVIQDTDNPDVFWAHVKESKIAIYPLQSGLRILTEKPEVIQALRAVRMMTTGGAL